VKKITTDIKQIMGKKYENLLNLLKNLKGVVVAFSGGVDSSVVAHSAYKILGKNALAVTIDSFVMPRKEIICAKKIAKEIGISHIVVKDKEKMIKILKIFLKILSTGVISARSMTLKF